MGASGAGRQGRGALCRDLGLAARRSQLDSPPSRQMCPPLWVQTVTLLREAQSPPWGLRRCDAEVLPRVRG